MSKQKKWALGLTGAFVMSSVSTNIIPIESVLAAKKSDLQSATDYANYLAASLKNNYLGSSNLPLFNETLAEGKRYLRRIPSSDDKRKLSASLARSEAVIRATESIVKLEQSMTRNSHTLRNVPTFETYLNITSKRIDGLTHSEVQDAKTKLAERSYAKFNDIRDIKIKNTNPYVYANQLFTEGKMLYNIAKDNPIAKNVKLADDRISDALNAVWKISTSRIKDKLRNDVKALLLSQSKLPGSTIPNGGGNGNGGTGNSSAPKIILAGNVYMTIPLKEKYKEPGFEAIDEADGIITSKVKITYMNVATNEYADTIPTDKSAVYQVAYTVTDSNKNQGTAYRFLAIGDAKIPGADGNNTGSSSSDKTPPVIMLKGNEYVNVKIGDKFEDPKYEAYDLVDGNLTSQVKVTITNKVTGQASTTIPTTAKGLFEIKYTVSDKAGNVATVYRFVQVDEKGGTEGSNPVITLTGNSAIYIKIGGRFTEPGYSAKDSTGANITSSVKVTITNKTTGQIVTSIPTTTKGSFEIKYTVSDKAGNSTTVSRTVVVNASGSNEGTTDPDSSGITISISGGYEDGQGLPPSPYGTRPTIPTATATDAKGNSVPVKTTYKKIENGVDREPAFDKLPTEPGDYSIIYTATKDGVSKTAKLRVTLQSQNKDKVADLKDLIIGKTVPINVNLNKAREKATINYIKGSSIDDMYIEAESGNAEVKVTDQNGRPINVTKSGNGFKFIGNIAVYSKIIVEVTPVEGAAKEYTIELKPIEASNEIGIVDAILKAETKGEVYILLAGAFGDQGGIINRDWSPYYTKHDVENNASWIDVYPNSTPNKVYIENKPMTPSGYATIKRFVHAVNKEQVTKDDLGATSLYNQSFVTGSIEKFLEKGSDTNRYLAHSISKEYLFKIAEEKDATQIYNDILGYLDFANKLSDEIIRYPDGKEVKVNGMSLSIPTNLEGEENYGLNDKLDKEYMKVLGDDFTTGSVRMKIKNAIQGKSGIDYPSILSMIINPANDMAVENTINILSEFNRDVDKGFKESNKSIPGDMLSAIKDLRDKTSHRIGTYPENGSQISWVFEFDDEALVEDWTWKEKENGNKYFLDINYKYYAEELAKYKGKNKPHLVMKAIEDGNSRAKDKNDEILGKALASINDSNSQTSIDKMVLALDYMYKMIVNENTKQIDKYKNAGDNGKQAIREVAEKLIKHINKDTDLTIKQIIDHVPVSELKDSNKANLLQKSIKLYKEQIEDFESLASELANRQKYAYAPTYKVDEVDPTKNNGNQWAEQRKELIKKIKDSYISEDYNYLDKPGWYDKFNSDAVNSDADKIAHYIISNHTDNTINTDRDQKVSDLKSKATIKDKNSAMDEVIKKALEVYKMTDMNSLKGPEKPPTP